MQKIKKGDTVIVIAGRSKGIKGQVLQVMKNGQAVIVDKANMVSKCQRPNPNANEPGGIITKEAPLNIAKVAIFNPGTGKPDRVGFKQVDNRYVRIFKSNQEHIDA